MSTTRRAVTAVLLLLAPLLPAHVAAANCNSLIGEWSNIIGDDNNIVQGPYTIRYLEQEFLRQDPASGKLIPFGSSNAQWLIMKSIILPDDRIYRIYRMGQGPDSGYHVLVRDECILETLL